MRKTHTSTIKLLLFLLWLLSTATVTVTFPVWSVPSAYAQTCELSNLHRTIEHFQDAQKRQSAKDTLKQCGEASVAPLTDALSDQNESIRINAVQVLGSIGAEAHPAIPILLATGQDDGNLEVRHNALEALAFIGQDLKIQADSLTGWQIREIQILQKLVQGLDETLDDLEQDKTEWQTKAKDLEALRLTRNGLQNKLDFLTALPSYRVRVWIQDNPWVWLLFLLLVGCIAIWTLKGLPIRHRERILNLLKPIIIFLPTGLAIYGALVEFLNASDLRVMVVELTPLPGYEGEDLTATNLRRDRRDTLYSKPLSVWSLLGIMVNILSRLFTLVADLTHHSEGIKRYPNGFKVSINLKHNGLGEKKIDLNQMEIKIEEYKQFADYTHQPKGADLIGAGTSLEHEFFISLSGLNPSFATWTTIEYDKKDNKTKVKPIEAGSKNIIDTPGGKYKFEIKKNDTDRLKGRVYAEKPGSYRVKFRFFYSVDGEKRNKDTQSVYIYAGDQSI